MTAILTDEATGGYCMRRSRICGCRDGNTRAQVHDNDGSPVASFGTLVNPSGHWLHTSGIIFVDAYSVEVYRSKHNSNSVCMLREQVLDL